jgi:hypothetical protein
LYRFTPLEQKLTRHLDPNKVDKERLVIPVVSLQAGPLDPPLQAAQFNQPYEFDSIVDQIIGSASIPLAIEPRLARLWISASVINLDDDTLTVKTTAVPGLPDPECNVLVSTGLRFSCEQLAIKRQVGENGEETKEWYVRLRLSSGSVDQWKNALPHDGNLKLSVRHQLIDGGTTSNVPIFEAVQRRNVDAIIVIGTGEVISKNFDSTEVRGALNVADRAFEMLWHQYQEVTVNFYSFFPDIARIVSESYLWVERATKWRDELERKLGKEKMQQLEAGMTTQFPREWPDLGDFVYFPRLIFIRPHEKFFVDTLDVRPDAIQKALEHGCRQAAKVMVAYREASPRSTDVEITDKIGRMKDPPEADLCIQLRSS